MTLPGLYLHIPFCRSKCGYCNFYSIINTGDLSAFIKALLKEVSLYKHIFDCFDTVYIGGGTPSILSVENFEELLKKISQEGLVAEGTEITVEVNPSDIDLSYLSSLRRFGVNRLNIGIQSFDDGTLQFLGRRHNRQQAFQVMDASFAAGFDNIGIDLIYGVPGQALAAWLETLSQALSCRPQHLSCYQLTLEADTPLGLQYAQNRFQLPDEEEQADFFMKTSEFMEDAGYFHYEVSNFAASESLVSRHNQKYWKHTPYLGVGPSAHSFFGGKRWWNHRSVRQYIGDLAADKLPVEGFEILSPEQWTLEALFLGFRTRAGIDLSHFEGQFQCNLYDKKREALQGFAAAGLIEIQGHRIRPTRAGMAIADALALL